MFTFMAGATTSGHVQASAVVVSRSSAKPFAILAMTFAVQGAMTKQSASCASDTWCMGSDGSSNRPTATGSRVSARNVVGPTNSAACSVMTTFALTPAFCRRRTISQDL